MNLTIASIQPRDCYRGDKWLGIPHEALRDLGRIYLLAVFLILVASFWEYFVP